MTDPTTFTQPIPPPLYQCGRCKLFFPTREHLQESEPRQSWACADCTTRIAPSQPPSADDAASVADGEA